MRVKSFAIMFGFGVEKIEKNGEKNWHIIKWYSEKQIFREIKDQLFILTEKQVHIDTSNNRIGFSGFRNYLDLGVLIALNLKTILKVFCSEV